MDDVFITSSSMEEHNQYAPLVCEHFEKCEVVINPVNLENQKSFS